MGLPGLPPRLRNRVWSLLVGVTLTLAGASLALNGGWPEPVQRLEGMLYDLRMRLVAGTTPEDRITIIDIDEASLAELGQWPWPRDVVAELLARLVLEQQVALVGVDVLFAEADPRVPVGYVQAHLESGGDLASLPLPDAMLAEVLEQTPVVLSMALHPLDDSLRKGQLGQPLQLDPPLPANAPVPRAKGAVGVAPEILGPNRVGFFDNPLIDADGVNRRVPLVQEFDGAYYPSLAVAVWMELTFTDGLRPVLAQIPGTDQEVLEALDIGGVTVPVAPNAGYQVRFRHSGSDVFQYISAADILLRPETVPDIAGKIALIGTSAVGLNDIRVTPVSGGAPGIEVHANMLGNFLDQSFLVVPDYAPAADAALILLLGLALTFALVFLGVRSGSALAVLLMVGVVVGNYVLFDRYGLVLPLVGVLTTGLLVMGGVQITGYVFETRSRRNLVRTFSQYVPEDLAKSLSESGLRATLQGETRDMTVMFADVRNFTTIAEALSPQDVTRLLNTVFTEMTALILQNGGTVDKYIGDGLMAFWGAPQTDPDHALHATQAAQAMVKALPTLNATLERDGLPAISIGVGLSSGQMNVGNMGSDFRVSYTVIGDAVNLGARLEALTKDYATPVIASDATVAACPVGMFAPLGEVRVKGKTAATKIYALSRIG